ncbi:MAG: YtxH domain-containing protein [Rikenellaceae bacterium]
MKNNCTILCSAIGGAILGSAVTLFLAPKSGKHMREMAHSKIIEQLNAIRENLKMAGCKCTEDGKCDCDMPAEGEEQMSM